MNLNEFIEKLPRYTRGTFATATDNKTHIRGWQFQFAKDNKFYFATNRAKNVYKELNENPYASFFAMVNNECFDITGEGRFLSDENEKQEALSNLAPNLQKMLPSIDAFECFVMEKGFARYTDNMAKPFEVIEF